LPLNSTKVSKVHALIVRQAGGVYVRDLASRNHLYVNAEPVTEAERSAGDAVRGGAFTLQCASGFGGEDGGAEETGPGVAPGAPRAALEVVGEAARVPLGARTALIGHRDDCELSLADDRVAPVHAVVFELDGKHVLRDLNSSAGTFVNNERIHQEELTPGDEIRIGRVRVKYAVEGMPEADDEESPAGRPIDLAELDDELPIEVETEAVESDEVEDPANHPLTTPVVALPALEDLVDLEEVSVPGVIDAGVSAVTAEPVCPEEKASSPDVASIPLPTRGGLEWSQENRPPPLQPLPGAEPGFEEGADDPDRPEARDGDDSPARELDRIVSELSDKVAELETTWREVKEDK
jgi:pSer/pThr/pTyr-binding forkhead associated (FHA) protein